MEKSNKKRVLAWIIGIVVFVGIVIGAICIKNYVDDQTIGNGAYIKVIQSRYEKVDETLIKRIDEDINEFWTAKNKKIDLIKFEETNEAYANLRLYYEAEQDYPNRTDQLQGSALYKVSLNYYNSLVDAEESDNMILYLDALNEVFAQMQLVEKNYHRKYKSIKFDGCDEDASEKINELLALDFEKEGIVKQVAFLSYRIELADWAYDEVSDSFAYTYKLFGISYCEIVDENNDEIEQGGDLVSNKTYNKNHIKAYYRDVEITARDIDFVGQENQLQDGIIKYINKEKIKSDFEVKTTYFEETTVFNVMKEYENMKKGNFDYRKPDNVDMREYTK